MVEHDTIDEAIDTIDILIRREDILGLRDAAVAFAELLEAHFTHEEHSPMFTTLAREDAVLGAKVDTLLLEHVEMRADMRALLESDDLAAGLRALMNRLDAHEKIELALLEHAFTATRT